MAAASKRVARNARHLLACAFLILSFLAPPASADFGPSAYESVLLLVQAGRFDEARMLAVAPAKTERARQLNSAFVEALILKRKGRYREAAEAYRTILATNPRFDAVRAELAHTLYLAGDDKAASYQFGVLSAATMSTSRRGLYDSYLAAIESRRPLTWSAFVTLAPSSNLNGGTDDGTVLVGGIPFIGEKRKSGVGLGYGLSGAYRFDLGAKRSLVLGAGLTGKIYEDDEFDNTTFQTFGEFSQERGPWRFGLGVGAEWRTDGWESTRWGVGPQASIRRSFGRAGTLVATASWRAMRYQQDTFFDGSEINLGFRYNYAFTPATTMTVGVNLTRRLTEISAHDYVAVRPVVEVFHEFSNGLIGDASLSYEIRHHDSDYFLLSEPRHDEILTASAGVTFRRFAINGFAPRIEYTFERYESNSERGDTTNHGIGFTLSKRY